MVPLELVASSVMFLWATQKGKTVGSSVGHEEKICYSSYSCHIEKVFLPFRSFAGVADTLPSPLTKQNYSHSQPQHLHQTSVTLIFPLFPRA